MSRLKICGKAAIALGLALAGIGSARQSTAQQPTNEVRKAMVWKRFQYVCQGNAKVTVYLRDELAKVRYEDKQYLMKQTEKWRGGARAMADFCNRTNRTETGK
jgi:hypothetical protein